MRRVPLAAAPLGLAALALTLAAPAAAATPAPPSGAYRVVRMADLYDQTHAGYKPDDPRLVGRAVTLTPGAARIDFGRGDCPSLSARGAMQSPAAVLSKAQGAPGRAALKAAFAEIGLDAAKPTRTFTLRCAAQGRQGEAWNDAVLFAADRGRWALVLAGELALVLDRPMAAAAPSFPCARTAGAAEQAICSDPDLAAWDRSVAEAFKRARAVGDPNAVTAEQKAWLVERDRCGGDKACLSKSLRDRTDALMQAQ